MVEFLTASMFTPAEWDEYGNDVTTSEQYQEKLKVYQTWFKRDQSARYTLWSCMHDDLFREFDGCPTAKDMWDSLKIRFDQTSAIRLRILRLKQMQFQLDAGRPMTEQLWTLSGIVCYLKAASQDIPEDEQALNVIRALPDTKLWQNFSQVMAHNENIKTFDAISKHLEMEDKRQKSLVPPCVALVAKGSKPKGKRPFRSKQAKKG